MTSVPSVRKMRALAGAAMCVGAPLLLSPTSFLQVNSAPRGAQTRHGHGPRAAPAPDAVSGHPTATANRSSMGSLGATVGFVAAITAMSVGRRQLRARGHGSSLVSCHATPQRVPVMDLDGNEVGEEIVNFDTLSDQTANYVVHHVITVWRYQQRKTPNFVKRRSDTKKGKKPWAQKGTGRARHGSMYSPLFGKSATNKAPHGLDNIRRKKNDLHRHYKAISTVLQSKWRGITVVEGLEDGFPEPRQKKMEQCIRNWTGLEPGSKHMLMITRSGSGTENPLFRSGNLIPKLEMRRPCDIDPMSDGLFRCLMGRRLLISREAFHDLIAKYGKGTGWALKSKREILVEQMNKLALEYPMDRFAEIESALEVPRSQPLRLEWAKEKRQELAMKEAA